MPCECPPTEWASSPIRELLGIRHQCHFGAFPGVLLFWLLLEVLRLYSSEGYGFLLFLSSYIVSYLRMRASPQGAFFPDGSSGISPSSLSKCVASINLVSVLTPKCCCFALSFQLLSLFELPVLGKGLLFQVLLDFPDFLVLLISNLIP